MDDAVVPAAAQPHPDIWVRLDVLHILRLVAELRDEPELVADAAAAQWSAARLTRLAARRLQQCRDGQPAHHRVGDVSLKELGKAVTQVLGHWGLLSHHPQCERCRAFTAGVADMAVTRPYILVWKWPPKLRTDRDPRQFRDLPAVSSERSAVQHDVQEPLAA